NPRSRPCQCCVKKSAMSYVTYVNVRDAHFVKSLMTHVSHLVTSPKLNVVKRRHHPNCSVQSLQHWIFHYQLCFAKYLTALQSKRLFKFQIRFQLNWHTVTLNNSSRATGTNVATT